MRYFSILFFIACFSVIAADYSPTPQKSSDTGMISFKLAPIRVYTDDIVNRTGKLDDHPLYPKPIPRTTLDKFKYIPIADELTFEEFLIDMMLNKHYRHHSDSRLPELLKRDFPNVRFSELRKIPPSRMHGLDLKKLPLITVCGEVLTKENISYYEKQLLDPGFDGVYYKTPSQQ